MKIYSHRCLTIAEIFFLTTPLLKYFGYILIISILLAHPVNSQVYFFRKYNTHSGLIQNTVKKIKQDTSGRLWIGTAEGLSIYDGEEFINYSHEDGLTNLVINCFYEVNDSVMLVGSNGGGVYVFQKRSYEKDTLTKIFSGKEFLINNNVNIILKDWENNYWLCTDSGLTKWSMPDISSGKMEVNHFGKSEGFPGLSVYGNVNYKDKILWLGTEAGLIKSDGRKFSLVKNLSSNFIYTIFADSDSLIIGTSDKILTNKNGKFYNFGSCFNLQDVSTGNILKDSKGVFWFATSKGLLRAQGNNFDVINHNYGLEEDFLFSVIEDIEGSIWIGSINGLYKYTNDSFSFIKESNVLKQIKYLKFDDQEKLWVVTKDGIYTIEKGQIIFSELNKKYPLIKDIIFTKAGEAWIATSKGIYFHSPKNKKKNKSFGIRELAPAYQYRICSDKEDNLWIQDIKGKIFLLKSDTLKLLNDEDHFGNVNFPQDLATFMFGDSRNNMWLGYFRYGLFRISNDSIKKFSAEDGLYDDEIRYIYENSFGEIWIGTRYGGAYRYADGKFTQYSTKNGLNSNWIRTIIEDNLGNMWFGTAKGVVKYDGKTWQVFDEAKGIQAGEIFCTAIGRNGTIYFGASNGIYFNQSEMQIKNIAPQVLIKKVLLIDGKNIIPSGNYDFSNSILFKSYNDSPSFPRIKFYTFPHYHNSLILEFVSTSLRDEDKTLYSYKLEGFDKNWSRLSNRNYVSYINLPSGEYKFLVKAKNGDGFWSEYPAEINFIITPPFWEEWWFRLSASLFVIGLVALITTLINRYRMAQQLKLEKMRTKIAADLHDDIGTSLSGIAIFSQLAKHKIKSGAQHIEEYLDKIEITSRTLIDAMSDIVWSIDPRNDSLEDAILKMEDFASKLFEAKGIDLQMSVSREMLNIKISPDLRRNLLLIFKEMTANVVKHSGATSAIIEIKIDRADSKGKTLIIKVEDNGFGFDIEKDYKGKGLKNLKLRSDSINGELKISSNEEMGTSYFFQMRLKN